MFDIILQHSLELLARLVIGIKPYLPAICFVLAWLITFITLWSVARAFYDSFQSARRMHQIPCARCRFATGDLHLKCPVHPREAFSEQAIGCADYEADEAEFAAVNPLSKYS